MRGVRQETNERVYADYAGGRWEYWTPGDGGRRVYIGAQFARLMVRQGARLVNANPARGNPPL